MKKKILDNKYSKDIFLGKGSSLAGLNKRLCSNKNFVEFLSRLISSFFYAGKKYKFNSLLQICSARLKIEIGLNFVQSLYLVYCRLLPFVVLKPRQIRKGTYGSKKFIITPRGQTIRARTVLLISWLKNSIAERSEKKLEDKIVSEIVDILNNKGKATSLRQEYYKFILNEVSDNVKQQHD